MLRLKRVAICHFVSSVLVLSAGWPRNDTKCGATCADSVTCHSGVTRPEQEKVTSRTVTCWRHMPPQRRHYKVRDYEVGKQQRQEREGLAVRLGKSRNEKAA